MASPLAISPADHCPSRFAQDPRRGFTLLELLLALLISGVIFGALGMFIDLQLRTVDSTRTEVEQAHQARALLRLIADDLRCAVR